MPADTDAIARAGYNAWRDSATTILPPWEFLAPPERHRWRLAAEGVTPEEVRERCCIGLYIAPWMRARLPLRRRWRLVAEAMAQARRIDRAA